jgi:hypothetical protein
MVTEFLWRNMSESDDPEYRNGDGAIKMRLKKTDCEDVN